MKCKWIALLLSAALILSMTACSEEETTQTDTADAPIDTTPVEITPPAHVASWSEKLNAVAVTPESDFTVSQNADGVTLEAYHGTAADVRVPAQFDGRAVTAVKDEALKGNTTLKTLIIPDTVTNFGTSILAGCTSLEALSTPLPSKGGKTHLGYLFGADTYQNNSRDVPSTLCFLRISGPLTTLPAYALYDCNDLLALELPENLQTIGKFAVAKCERLSEVRIPDGVTAIGEYAFSDCEALSVITLGEHVSTIGFSAFLGCQGIRSMTLPFVGETPAKNTYLAYLFGAEHPDFAKGFYPPKLSRVEILSGCKTLGGYAFFECESLKEVILPDGLETVGVRAFYDCVSLWQIKLPDSVKTVREAAFTGCESLLRVEFGKSLSSLGINAFYGCDSLKSITLPESLKSLPASAFADCKALKAVDLGGVTEVGAQAFRNCYAVETVKAKEGITFDDGNHTVSEILE